MSSEQFALTTVGAQLDERLRGVLPGITVRDADKAPTTNMLTVHVTYEQLDVAAEYEGARLAPGWVAVNFELGLLAPEKDPSKGNDTLFTHLPTLITALDEMDDISWSRAQKGRDAAGTYYKIPITLFATTTQEADNA